MIRIEDTKEGEFYRVHNAYTGEFSIVIIQSHSMGRILTKVCSYTFDRGSRRPYNRIEVSRYFSGPVSAEFLEEYDPNGIKKIHKKHQQQ